MDLNAEHTYGYGPRLKPPEDSLKTGDTAPMFAYTPAYPRFRNRPREVLLLRINFSGKIQSFCSDWFPQIANSVTRFSRKMGSTKRNLLLIDDVFQHESRVTDVFFRRGKKFDKKAVMGDEFDAMLDRTPLYRIHTLTNSLFKYVGDGVNYALDNEKNWEKISLFALILLKTFQELLWESSSLSLFQPFA